MRLLDEIMANEVYPAMGCTEPIACAYAAAVAAEHLPNPVEALDLKVDTGTFKNGAAVTVPNSGGMRGNLAAAAIGAILGRSAAKLELLRDAGEEQAARARTIIDAGMASYTCLNDSRGFRVEVTVSAGESSARCVLSEGHANVERIEENGQATYVRAISDEQGDSKGYRVRLKALPLAAVIDNVTRLDERQEAALRRGVEMNVVMAERGYEVPGAATQLKRMRDEGILAEDLFYRVKSRVAGAVDARMAGIAQPVMTSGGSGNQGIVAILTPYLVGRERDIPVDRILESLAVAHALNAYIKCYVGELSVICGCAMAAGIAAAVAIVYQEAGPDMEKIGFAINNVVGDLSGLICDGAKPGCAMKTVSSVDAAMRAAFMALSGFGPSHDEGMVGVTPEDSIRNLGRITLEGMFPVDPTLVDIMADKAKRGQA